jgi:hypothetical protein
MSSAKSGSMGLKAQGVNHPDGMTPPAPHMDVPRGKGAWEKLGDKRNAGAGIRLSQEGQAMRGVPPPPSKEPVKPFENDDTGTDSYWQRQEDSFNRKRAFSNPVKSTPPRKA